MMITITTKPGTTVLAIEVLVRYMWDVVSIDGKQYLSGEDDHGKLQFGTEPLPPGQWQYIGTTETITEEEAADLVKQYTEPVKLTKWYLNYERSDPPHYSFNDPIDSLRSAIKAHGGNLNSPDVLESGGWVNQEKHDKAILLWKLMFEAKDKQLTTCQEENKRLKNAIEAIKHLCEDHKKSDSALTHIELIIAMLPIDLLKGKMISVKTDVGTEAILEIAKVEKDHHYQQTGPSNRENDWWPDAREWDTWIVHFTNGHKKEYESIEQINVLP